MPMIQHTRTDAFAKQVMLVYRATRSIMKDVLEKSVTGRDGNEQLPAKDSFAIYKAAIMAHGTEGPEAAAPLFDMPAITRVRLDVSCMCFTWTYHRQPFRHVVCNMPHLK